MLLFALLLGAVWGVVWALYLQFNERGQWLATHRTWITVIVGVGGDLTILWLLLAPETWLKVFGVIAASSIGIIARSLYNEHLDEADGL